VSSHNDGGCNDIRPRIVEYAELNPDAGVIEALGEMGLSPGEWRDTVADALEAEDPSAAVADFNEDVDHPEDGDEGDAAGGSDVTPVAPADGPADIIASEDPDRAGEDSAQAGETPFDATKTGEYADIDFTDIADRTYPETLLEAEQWMGRKGKLPFAPWGDRNAALECSHTTCTDHDGEAAEEIVEDCPNCQTHRNGTTTAECDHDARYKWGHDGHYVDGERAAMAEDDPRLDGRVFLQRDSDQFAFVDGDDVRCPETGDVHPAFLALLDRLGGTYADISTSGAGVHAYYIGDLPDEKGQAVFDIDDEPWGENDDTPTVEIYANKHVCVTTGDHVAGTPADVVEWDTGALEEILDEYLDEEEERPDVEHDTDRDLPDLDDYDAEATTADESASDVRDILHAVDRLRPSDVPLRTRQVGSDSTGWEQWDPSSYRTSSGNDSLHKPAGEAVFHDHKLGESFGVLSLFAAEQGIINKPWHRLAGSDWWEAVEAARESGAPIPEYETTGGPNGASGGAFGPEECAPPAVEFATFDAKRRWSTLQDDRYEEYLQSTGPTIWGDHAGAGKTTNAGRAAAQRDRPFVLLFDKHEKAREFATDSATPAVDMHLKGAEQKRHEGCMDADHADESCPEHGTNGCPHMCPIYDLDPDDEDRKQYEAVVEEVGPVQAHMLLDLPFHDDDGCLWIQQFDEVESADRIVGVHEYQTLKTVRKGRDVIVDESPSSLMSERKVSIEGLARAATALESLANISGMPESLTSFGRFARDIMDAVTGEDTGDTLAALSPPAVEGETFYEEVDPDNLPADVEPEDVQLREMQEDVGMPGEGYITREKHVVERDNVGEELAQLKLAYNESIVSRIRRGEWNGAPLCFDALLAAAAEAGTDTKAARQAIAIPTLLEHCPWCGSDVAEDDGARVCADEECDWHEEHHPVTSQQTEQARALSWLGLGEEDPAGLHYAGLPLASSLPSTPLVLDATATPSKVAGLYDVPVSNVDVSGSEPLEANLHTTQVVDGQYHRGTLKESRSACERIQQTIETVGKIHDRPLFIGPKKLLNRFEFPSNGERLHYHGARGLNRADCDAVVCIGAPHPRMDDLQREAELFAQGSTDVRVGGEEHSTRRDAPNPEVWRKLLYEDDTGTGRAVATKHFTGLVGDLFRETREKELVQAVHRIRPLLADEEKHAYLLTNVPTELPIDELATFEELADPLKAVLPVSEQALELAECIRDAGQGSGPDGFRAETLVEHVGGEVAGESDNAVRFDIQAMHRLASLNGIDVTERTVRRWVADLVDVGLLDPGEYKPRAGVDYTADSSTLTDALLVITSNAGVEVAAKRRFRRVVEKARTSTGWLEWAREMLDLSGSRCDRDPPPDGPGSPV